MRKYRPSNGTEGECFIHYHCSRCIHDNGDNKICDILTRSMCCSIDDKDYPEEWVYDEAGNPTCTAWKKWDWGRDDDGNWIEPVTTPPDDPNQLCLPFIFDELGIKPRIESDRLRLQPTP